MAYPVVHFEVMGKDLGTLQSFYTDLFGWEVEEHPEMNYTIVQKEGEGIGGGIGQHPEGGTAVTFYVAADDIQATLDRAVELGATVLMPVTELPMVTLAMFADPEGNAIGLVKGM
jgi:predicted enzyme related to lactoylglutathione lyase